MTQLAQVLNHLKHLGGISSRMAFRQYEIVDVRTVMRDIRKLPDIKENWYWDNKKCKNESTGRYYKLWVLRKNRTDLFDGEGSI